jgi:hypothetical protein
LSADRQTAAPGFFETTWRRLFCQEIFYRASIDLEIAVPSNEEIKAARTVLTDDCIVDLKRGIAAAENVIKLMLEAAEKVRSADANVRPAPADWNEPHLWPVRPTDK